jgi:AcrR family transcriptional regulator
VSSADFRARNSRPIWASILSVAPTDDAEDSATVLPLRLPGRGGARLPVAEQPAAPRERADAARNRERILKAARRLMRRKPLDSICMDAIAEEAGVGKGTLYRRFPDRAALAHALLDEDARELQDRALAGFELGPTAPRVEHALTLLGALFDFALDHSAVLLAANAQHRGARYDHPAYAWQRSLLSGHLREAVRRGEAPPLDTLVTSELMLAGTSPELLSWITSRVDEARVRGALLDTWRRALARPGPCAAPAPHEARVVSEPPSEP